MIENEMKRQNIVITTDLCIAKNQPDDKNPFLMFYKVEFAFCAHKFQYTIFHTFFKTVCT